MKQTSFYATIAYGIIALISLFILSLYLNNTLASLLVIISMGLSYVSQMFYTYGFDKPHLDKWGNIFCFCAISFAVCSGVSILWSILNG